MRSDTPSGEELPPAATSASPMRLERPASSPGTPDPAQGDSSRRFSLLPLHPIAASAFDAHPPVTRDAFYAVALLLQLRTHHPELVMQHRGAGSLLLTPRLDAQATFAISRLTSCSRTGCRLHVLSTSAMFKPCVQICELKPSSMLQGLLLGPSILSGTISSIPEAKKWLQENAQSHDSGSTTPTSQKAPRLTLFVFFHTPSQAD